MTKDIELALSRGKTLGARKLLEEYYEKEDYSNWLAEKQKEYDGLFTNTYTRDIGFDSNTITNEDALKEYVIDELLEVEQTFVSCWFDEVTTGNGNYTYSAVEANVSFNDWINEIVVVQEAVYDNDILISDAIYEPLRPYIPTEVDKLVDAYITSRYKELRAAEYPNMTEFADAWVKQDEEALEAYRQKCLAVKAKYPKN